MEPIFFIAIVVLFIGGAAWYTHQANKKRTAALEQQSAAMGLQFDPTGGGIGERLNELNLMSVGRSQRAKNLISGDAGDVRISIFDYQYTTGSGKNSRTHSQTVVALESAGIQAPAFSMRQQNAWLDRIGKLLGGQDIDFDQHPKFSEMFVLKGPNEDAIRSFFSPQLIGYFETKVGHSIEGAHGKMILYKSGNRTPPEEIKDLLASAYEVYGHIVDQS